MQALRRLWVRGGSKAEVAVSQAALLRSTLGEDMTRDASAAGMNGVELRTRGEGGRNVVLLHGFGAGLGIFFRNLREISRMEGVNRVFVLDWLGMGGSDRPKCSAAPRIPLLYSKRHSEERVNSSVAFFVDAFENWRLEKALDEPFVIVGHSLGGYLATRYALQHRRRVASLVLASPAGLPTQPEVHQLSPQLPPGLRIMDCAWNSNVTPQQILRILGPRGPRVTRAAVNRRFGDTLSDAEKDLFADYLYHISVAPASGEYAMNSLLLPLAHQEEGVGVYARQPLLPLLLNTEAGNELLDSDTGVSVAYGTSDWLRNPAAERACTLLQRRMGTRLLQRRLNGGHHLYLDDPQGFVELIADGVKAAA